MAGQDCAIVVIRVQTHPEMNLTHVAHGVSLEDGTSDSKKSRKEQACEEGNDGYDHHELNDCESETAMGTTEHDLTPNEVRYQKGKVPQATYCEVTCINPTLSETSLGAKIVGKPKIFINKCPAKTYGMLASSDATVERNPVVKGLTSK